MSDSEERPFFTARSWHVARKDDVGTIVARLTPPFEYESDGIAALAYFRQAHNKASVVLVEERVQRFERTVKSRG